MSLENQDKKRSPEDAIHDLQALLGSAKNFGQKPEDLLREWVRTDGAAFGTYISSLLGDFEERGVDGIEQDDLHDIVQAVRADIIKDAAGDGNEDDEKNIHQYFETLFPGQENRDTANRLMDQVEEKYTIAKSHEEDDTFSGFVVLDAFNEYPEFQAYSQKQKDLLVNLINITSGVENILPKEKDDSLEEVIENPDADIALIDSTKPESYTQASEQLRKAEAAYNKAKTDLESLTATRKILGLFDSKDKKESRWQAQTDFDVAEQNLKNAQAAFNQERQDYLGPQILAFLQARIAEMDVQSKQGKLLKGLEKYWKASGEWNVDALCQEIFGWEDSSDSKLKNVARFVLKGVNVRNVLLAGLATTGAGLVGSLAVARGIRSLGAGSIAAERAASLFELEIKTNLGRNPWDTDPMTPEQRAKINACTQEDLEKYLSEMESGIALKGVKGTLTTDTMPPLYKELLLSYAEMRKKDIEGAYSAARVITEEEQQQGEPRIIEVGAAQDNDEIQNDDQEIDEDALRGDHLFEDENEEEEDDFLAGTPDLPQGVRDILNTMQNNVDVRLTSLKKRRRKAFVAGMATSVIVGGLVGAASHEVLEYMAKPPAAEIANLASLGHTWQEYQQYEKDWQPRLDSIRYELYSHHQLSSIEDLEQLRNMASWQRTGLGNQANELLTWIEHNSKGDLSHHSVGGAHHNILQNSGIEVMKVSGEKEISLAHLLDKNHLNSIDRAQLLKDMADSGKFGTHPGDLLLHQANTDHLDKIYFQKGEDGHFTFLFGGDSGHALDYKMGAPDPFFAPIYEKIQAHNWQSGDLFRLLKAKGGEELFVHYYTHKVGYLSFPMKERLHDYFVSLQKADGPSDMENQGVIFFKAFMDRHNKELLTTDWAHKLSYDIEKAK